MLISKATYTFSLEERSLLRLRDGREVFMKASGSSDDGTLAFKGTAIGRERTCLEVLQGLAVPELVRLPDRDVRAWLGRRHVTYVAQSVVGRGRLHSAKLRKRERLGAWCFIAEQMTAFRRHQILYTDIKCANIVVSRHPLRVTIVDFGCAAPLLRFGAPLNNSGYTPGWEPPEVRAGSQGTERSLVFQLGLLLPHLLSGLNDSIVHSPNGKISAFLGSLKRIGPSSLADLIARCLAADPKKRPATYEEVLSGIEVSALPEQARRVWHALRAPYAARLAEVGLEPCN